MSNPSNRLCAVLVAAVPSNRLPSDAYCGERWALDTPAGGREDIIALRTSINGRAMWDFYRSTPEGTPGPEYFTPTRLTPAEYLAREGYTVVGRAPATPSAPKPRALVRRVFEVTLLGVDEIDPRLGESAIRAYVEDGLRGRWGGLDCGVGVVENVADACWEKDPRTQREVLNGLTGSESHSLPEDFRSRLEGRVKP